MLRRKQSLKNTKPMKRSRIAQKSRRRKAAGPSYTQVKREHLEAHPYCQLTIAFYGFSESEVMDVGQPVYSETCAAFVYAGRLIPLATEIHHRNKSRGKRLTDTRWFASACRYRHDWVEDHKTMARAKGYLLPLEADDDGLLPSGVQCLPTDEWLKSMEN